MLGKARKRFYKAATLGESDGLYQILLDGRTPKTPAGRKLEVPFRQLGLELVAEWEAQDEEIKPHTMGLTQLVSTALDRIGPERAVIIDQLMKYAETELLCYRAEHPSDLVDRQARLWDPLLDWADKELGVQLVITSGIMAVDQPQAALSALRQHLERMDVWRLTVLQMVCAAAGSLILAFAMVRGRISNAEAFDLSALDENFQIERWGEDYEAKDRRDRLRNDIAQAASLLALIETNH